MSVFFSIETILASALNRVRAQDQAAFRQLFHAYFGRVANFLRAKLSGQDDVIQSIANEVLYNTVAADAHYLYANSIGKPAVGLKILEVGKILLIARDQRQSVDDGHSGDFAVGTRSREALGSQPCALPAKP